MDDFEKVATTILSEIKKASRFLLILHTPPDYDCLASCLAMKLVLSRMGKRAEISYGNNAKSQILADWLTSDEIIETKLIDIEYRKYDYYLSLDTAELQSISQKGIKIINIDHHDISNTNYGDINFVVKAPSACSVLYKLFKLWNIEIDSQMATLLFTGIWSDTQGLNVLITDKSAFSDCAELVKLGADFHKVAYWTSVVTPDQLKSVGIALAKLKLYRDDKIALTDFTLDDAKQAGLEFSTHGIHRKIINQMNRLYKVKISVVIKQKEIGWYVCLRSNNPESPIDITLLTKRMGGGGHKGAGGFDMIGELDNVRKKVLILINETYPDL